MPDTLPNRRQQGTALIIALVILASVTLLAVSAVNTSVSEIKMAVNEQLDMEAFQLAQSAIDAAVDTEQAFSRNLKDDSPLIVGDSNTIGFNDEAPFTEAAGEYVAASVTLTGDCLAPPRLRHGSDLSGYSARTFRVTGTVDKRATRQGAATLSEGVVILGAKCD